MEGSLIEIPLMVHYKNHSCKGDILGDILGNIPRGYSWLMK